MSAYLKGTGTKIDPFVIHNNAAFAYWLANECASSVGYYAVLVVDVSGTFSIYNYNWYGHLDCLGRKISGISNPSGSFVFYGSIENAKLYDCKFSYASIDTRSGCVLKNIDFGGVCSPIRTAYGGYTIDLILYNPTSIYYSAGSGWTGSGSGIPAGSVLYNLSTAKIPGAGVVNVADSDETKAESYPKLVALPNIWAVDGQSVPRLLYQNASLFTQAYAVKGVTKVGGTAKSRRCVAHSSVDFYRISEVVSGSDGSYLINCLLYSDHRARA